MFYIYRRLIKYKAGYQQGAKLKLAKIGQKVNPIQDRIFGAAQSVTHILQ